MAYVICSQNNTPVCRCTTAVRFGLVVTNTCFGSLGLILPLQINLRYRRKLRDVIDVTPVTSTAAGGRLLTANVNMGII